MVGRGPILIFVLTRASIALTGLLILGVLPLACQRATTAKKKASVRAVVKDTAGLSALFKDTGLAGNGLAIPDARTFKLRTTGQRDSLRATLRKERELWRAGGVRDYRFLLRVGCFCPGLRGWWLIEVRSGQPLRAWDRAGQAARIDDGDTFSIDGLFDNLERSADRDGSVQIAFDSRRHFPTFVRTISLPGPDAWATIEVRGLRPIGR